MSTASHHMLSTSLSRRVTTWTLAACLLSLAACSTPPRPTAPIGADDLTWSGRMGFQIHDPHTEEQSFSASFLLQGTPEQGSLDIFNPLGFQIAKLQWQPGAASLAQGQRLAFSDSLSELLRQSLGTEIPLQALFSWLQGIPVEATGWQVDLSRHAAGRITAQRLSPPPQATLRVVLQKPE